MLKGKVKWFAPARGYGFITGDDGHDYFVHYGDINMEGYKTLSPEQAVTFDTKDTEKGVAACNVTIVEEENN